MGALVTINHEDAFSGRGRSDLTVCYRGRFVALEVKRPGERPTDRQLVYLNDVERAGGVAAVVRSVEEARSVLCALGARVQGTEAVRKCSG